MIIKMEPAEGWQFYTPIAISYVPTMALAICAYAFGPLYTPTPVLGPTGLICLSVSLNLYLGITVNIAFQSLICLVIIELT